MSNAQTAIVLCGGGIKSAVAAARIMRDHAVVLVHVNFGQRSAAAEIRATRVLAEHLQTAPPVELELPHVLQLQQRMAAPDAGRSTQNRTGVVGSHALTASGLRGLLPVLLSIGLQAALRAGASRVITGISRMVDASHLGLAPPEAGVFSLPEFLQDFAIAGESFSRHPKVAIETPLVNLNYAQIARLSVHLQIPAELTWSCAGIGPNPCETCAQCRARRAAFQEALTPEVACATVPSTT